jgi:hypothetical protein
MGILPWKCELSQFHILPVEMVGYVVVPEVIVYYLLDI